MAARYAVVATAGTSGPLAVVLLLPLPDGLPTGAAKVAIWEALRPAVTVAALPSYEVA